MHKMTKQQQLRFWLGGVVAFLLFLYIFDEILLPFVVGMAVAYFLDPIVDRLEKRGLWRGWSALLVLTPFLLVVVLALVLLAPLLIEQVAAFAHSLPDYISSFRELVTPLVESLRSRLGEEQVASFSSVAGGYAGDVLAWVGGLFSKVWGGGLALVNLLSLIFIMPITAFYLLRDWDIIIARIDSWLPRLHAQMIRDQTMEVDRTLSGFVRGAAMVCLTLATIYGVGLTLIGLKFGLLIGIAAGLISFVPYVGAAIGLVIGTGLAYYQFPEITPVLLVAGTFLFGQTLESYVLTPRFVGDRIGLHPMWIIFALLAGGALFGFLGIFLAVPVAAVIGVLSRFLLSGYLKSSYYLGAGDKHAAKD